MRNCVHGAWQHKGDGIHFFGLVAWSQTEEGKKRRKDHIRERKRGEKTTSMAVNWWVNNSLCASHWGLKSECWNFSTDGAFNWLHRCGMYIGQSSNELMHSNPGILSLAYGHPLDQIMGQSVAVSLPSVVCWRWDHCIQLALILL